MTAKRAAATAIRMILTVLSGVVVSIVGPEVTSELVVVAVSAAQNHVLLFPAECFLG